MRSIPRKTGLAIGAGVASLALFGAVALASFAPDNSVATNTVVPTNAQDLEKDGKDSSKLKDLLDGLVKKGVITQAQADAIVAAMKDAAGARERGQYAKRVLSGLLSWSAKYLNLSEKDLHTKLSGQSLADLAAGTPGGRSGLVAALNTAANDAIAKALADKKITDEQAKALKDSLATKIPEFVDHKWPTRRTAAGRNDQKGQQGHDDDRGSSVRGSLADMTKAALDYLGLTKDQLDAALRGGNSLADIAVGQGKTSQGLSEAVTRGAFKRVDEAQAAGKLTADQANALKLRLSAEVKAFLERKPGAATNGRPSIVKTPPTLLRPATPNQPTTVTPPTTAPGTTTQPKTEGRDRD